MRFSALLLLVTMLSAVSGLTAEDKLPEPTERPEWGKIFEAHEAVGTMVVWDERAGEGSLLVFDKARAHRPYIPASTFKIPHALMALESGVVKDEFEVFPWDGEGRSIPAWNRDHNLRSSMRESVVWVYERFVNEIGLEREKEFLKRFDYGNAEVAGGSPFWLEGNLRISAMEQIPFLRKLYRNGLPCKVEHQRLVKDIMIVEADRERIVRAKTGWTGTLGWWVGWVEAAEGPVFFAMNMDTPKRLEDLPKREAVARAVLRELGALPAIKP